MLLELSKNVNASNPSSVHTIFADRTDLREDLSERVVLAQVPVLVLINTPYLYVPLYACMVIT